MVLQSTGVISLSNIQTEFGGINPISLSEYYQNNALGYTTGVTGIPNTGAAISISNFYGKAKPVSSLYSFTNHTFTNAGATGRTGPIISQVRSAYSAASWAQNASYLNMVTQGIQEWTVPATGNYSIEVAGAAGGNSGVGGGNGARMIGTFNLTQGMVLAILVGQLGVVKNSGCNAGGGGGTFVWNKSSTTQPLIVGGGGGGSNACGGTRGLDAPTTINGTGGFGTSVAGANGNGATPGGSGWLTNGTSGYQGNNSGTTRPLAGGLGGAALASYSIGDGGFGGGASASGEYCSNGGAGGGGGYSGGAGPSGDPNCGSGGGGGSYNSGTNQTNTAAVNTGHGYVIINYLSSTPPPPAPVISYLYSFTTHTFTNASAIGRTGPIISQVRSAYSAASWAQNASYLNMVTQGIQEWTVPATANYTIEVAGAAGANSGVGGGNGARMIGTFNLTQGMVLAILVGQLGVVKNSGCNAGGGGGTFVWNKSSTTQPLIVGGGGGGSNACGGTRGLDAPTTINGTGGFGTSVAGANGNGATPGGSGWLTNGTSGYQGNNSGTTRPLAGGLGGAALASYSIGDGGFGGGASASGETCSNGGAGGGGGYSGGAGPSGDANCGSGGGGGSYNSGTNQTNTAGVNAGHGYVIITINQTVSTPAPSVISSIANLVLWHNGYNIDGSNNSTLSSGTAISSWYNSGSDSSLTTTQFTSSSRPTYILNGAVFSSGKSLISNINLNLSTYTAMNIFIVWKKTQSSSGLKWLWSQDDGGYDRTLIINADSSLMIGFGNGGAVFPNYSFPINSVVIVNCEYNSSGQTGYFFINNTSLTTFSNLTASGTTTTQFGSNGGGSNSIDGIIHEILVISRILTTTERTDIYNALVAKY